ncbi:hypothetical protein ACP70R_021551 [Stipagrostis hirtigluma subsp. patula]
MDDAGALRGEVSGRAPGGSPAAAPAPAADEVEMGIADGGGPGVGGEPEVAGQGIAAERGLASVPPVGEPHMEVDDDGASGSVAPALNGANGGSILGGVRDLPPVVSEAKMEMGARGIAGEGHSAAPAASEMSGGSILGGVRDSAPVVSEAKMEVGARGIAGKGHPAAPAASEMSRGSTLGEVQDFAPAVRRAKMEVDDGCIPEQGRNAAAVASEVKVEEAEGPTVNQEPCAPAAAVQPKDETGESLVGRYVGRSAPGHVRILFGKVVSYDKTNGVYNVMFEDGRAEILRLPQLLEILMPEENGASGIKLSCRKRKLDSLVSSGTAASEVKEPASTRQRVDATDMSAGPVESHRSGSGADMSEDAETSSNSSDITKETPSEPCVPAQAVELPPSSGDVAVPEESISHLFSVYNFLRSFSVQLFLSPFGLDDFVASINCTVQNNLLDAVHVSLLRALRRHLETKSAEGSKRASNCLKYLDWRLLDALTWPSFLLEYLTVMSCIKSLGGRSFGRSLLAIEYYKLPVDTKLRVLQILCDHVIDSEELKTELEDREGYNEEMEYEMGSGVFHGASSRAVSTRASKAAACKRINDLQNMTAPNVKNQEAVAASNSQDGNSDDCRICGMDGTLVCCDGCPWAYHSRCIGQNKAFLPKEEWFCPECVVNKLGPTSSRIERGGSGAQMFGIDMCGRLFLGSCNYLLVVGTSSNAESYARYYNHYDVVKVIQVLALSDAYTDICRRIEEYWKHLPDIFQSERSKIGKGVGAGHIPQSSMSMSFTPIKAGDGSVSVTSKGGRDSTTVALPQSNPHHGFVTNQFTVCSAEHLKEQKCMTSSGVVTEKNNEVYSRTPSVQNNIHNSPINGAFGPSMVSSVGHHNGPIITGSSNITQSQPAQGSFCPDLSTRVSKTNGMFREYIMNPSSAKAEPFCPSYQRKHHLKLIAERSGNMSGGKPAKLSTFKPQAYVNLYIHGNIAASAAANLAVIRSDEGKVSASQLATNQRKKMAADNALQLKAFSSATAQFVWPSTEKKLMEVPRDRCGWCLACGSSAIGNKKACFLNMATANAAKGSARILSSMRLVKISDSHFPSIVAYLANMEESLRGLLIGSLQDMQQKQRWHKQLQEASNCRTVVPLLLELESNIRGVAFSASWFKLIDEWPMESPGVSIGASRPAAYQKRGTGGRRRGKRSLASESGAVTDDDNSWAWLSSGNISKRTLQRGALLCSAMRKTARQGGKKRIPGIIYHEGSDLPRRTQQSAWRACVGLSQNSSQLALQVRYLDAHIRWKEFIPPDQTPLDGKSSESDSFALRNAVLCDKKIVDNKIRYALKFANQKDLPVRVTKNILEAEDNQDENRKLWFSENHVPLYMVREFEQQAGVSSSPTLGMFDAKCFTRRAKASTGDVFSYLFNKGVVYPCTSCKKDVLYRDVVKCSSCQGDCHKECTSSSVGCKGGNAISSLICTLCVQKGNLMLTGYNTNSSYIQYQQKSDGQQPVTAPKIVFKVGSSHSAEPAVKVEAQPLTKVEAKSHATVVQPILNAKAQPIAKVETHPLAMVEALPTTNGAIQSIASAQAQPKTKSKQSKSQKPRKPKKVQVITYFGLVWKKNKNDNDGSDFRANDVILKSKDGVGSSIKPTCCLCKKPYSPDFLYVRCETCRNWFHGDALQLEEEKIVELLAYRCCRCRRRAIPQCPHSADYTKPEPEFSEQTVATSSQSTILSGDETFALSDQDPLLSSYGIVEPIGEETLESDLSNNMVSFTPGSAQKLSIRRARAKSCEYLDQAGRPANEYYIQNEPHGNADTSFSHMNEVSLSETDNVNASELLGWDFSQGTAYAAPPDFPTNSQLNDTSRGSFAREEYEPQTFFSFTELLEADDTQLNNAFGMSTGLQDDGNCDASFDQQGVSFDETALVVEDGSSNMNFPTNDPSNEMIPCNKCNNTQPLPDLKCAVCGLHIHHQCSPWEESAEPAESWRCGACREWH